MGHRVCAIELAMDHICRPNLNLLVQLRFLFRDFRGARVRGGVDT